MLQGPPKVPRFPIDEHLPKAIELLREHSVLILEAPPGAGKTTRIPEALLRSGILANREIVISEPRRLAAKLAASFVAETMNEPVGRSVGYQVRFEDRTSTATRIRYVTAGVLLRQLQSAPELCALADKKPAPRTQGALFDRVGAIILDEFHERHIDNDLILTLLKGLLDRGTDLKLIVMSATLNSDRLVEFFAGAPRIVSEGRSYPLSIEHASEADARPLEKQVASAVRKALNLEGTGHILVFVPTVRDIQRCSESLSALAAASDVEVLPLHGEMPLEAQTRAVRPSERRKIVVCTNVAESSVTVPGVTCVIDTGLARSAEYSHFTGRRELKVMEVSQASAIQRAGRAGRTAAGTVYRLFTQANFQARRSHDIPEIQRADLSEAWLGLIGAGVGDPRLLPWLDAPGDKRADAALSLLQALGAITADLSLSALGTRMLKFPTHPRLARVLVCAEDLGVAEEACLAVALLSERDIIQDNRGRRHAGTASSDLAERMDLFFEAQGERFSANVARQLGLAFPVLTSVARAFDQLRRLVRRQQDDPPDREKALLLSLLAGFSDRLARRRRPGERELILANGSTARLADSSVVQTPLLLALDVEQRSGADGRGGAIVNVASTVHEEWLLDHHAESLTMSETLEWNADKERVERISRLSFGSVLLDETKARAMPAPDVSALLARTVRNQKGRFASKLESVAALAERLALVTQYFPALAPTLAVTDRETAIIELACEALSSFAELEAVNWTELLLVHLDPKLRQALHEQTPSEVTLGNGRRIPVHYEPGKSPWASSRLQDFFGSAIGPSICSGRVPLTLHLLAPNGRAVQVTTDLQGFWIKHYPATRRELMRRYPRHPWPEDPRNAPPPPPRPPRPPR